MAPRPAEVDEADRATPPHALLRAGQLLRQCGRAVLDTVVPPLCISCHAPLAEHDSLCSACWRRIDFIREPLCDRLGIPLPFGGSGPHISAAALASPPPYTRARAVARFDGVMRDLVHAFKYGDRHDGRRLFSRWLLTTGRELIETADVIVPVPLARLRLWNRRFNQAQILAKDVARLSGRTCLPHALRRVRATTSQVGLTADQRRRNVQGAFAVAPRSLVHVREQRVLLVDDVITTGATVGAASMALLRAGARSVDVLALAIATETVSTAL